MGRFPTFLHGRDCTPVTMRVQRSENQEKQEGKCPSSYHPDYLHTAVKNKKSYFYAQFMIISSHRWKKEPTVL